MKRTEHSVRTFRLAPWVALAALAAACAKEPGAATTPAPAPDAAPATVSAAPAPAGDGGTEVPMPTSGAAESAIAPPPTEGRAPGQQALDASEIPAVVARIDGESITKVELLARATEARGTLAQRGTPLPPPTRAFYRKVLDDLIANRLLSRDLAAQRKGATPEEIAARLQALRNQFPSDAAFDQALAERGFDRTLLERDVAESVAVQKWIQTEVIPTVSVTEGVLRAFFDANPERMIEPESARARHILVRVDAQAAAQEKQDRRSRIEALRERLAGGADFATVARESSDDKGSGARGGDLGWFYRGQMVPPFEQAAFALQPNQLSGVVETRFGFHLIEVLEKRSETRLTFEQVRDRLEAMLRQQQLEDKVRSRINELGAQATIEILL